MEKILKSKKKGALRLTSYINFIEFEGEEGDGSGILEIKDRKDENR